jgi:hypothetical protein
VYVDLKTKEKVICLSKEKRRGVPVSEAGHDDVPVLCSKLGVHRHDVIQRNQAYRTWRGGLECGCEQPCVYTGEKAAVCGEDVGVSADIRVVAVV